MAEEVADGDADCENVDVTELVTVDDTDAVAVTVEVTECVDDKETDVVDDAHTEEVVLSVGVAVVLVEREIDPVAVLDCVWECPTTHRPSRSNAECNNIINSHSYPTRKYNTEESLDAQ